MDGRREQCLLLIRLILLAFPSHFSGLFTLFAVAVRCGLHTGDLIQVHIHLKEMDGMVLLQICARASSVRCSMKDDN